MSEKLKFVKAGPLRVLAFGGGVGNAPVVGDDRTISTERWARFGSRNLFPEYCRALADNCSPLDACVNTMAQFVAGTGVDFLDEQEQPVVAAERAWMELTAAHGEEAVREHAGADIALMNAIAWQVINSRRGAETIIPLDICRTRLAKREDGVIKSGFFSSNWAKIREARYKEREIPMFGMPEATNEGLLYVRAYKQLRDYYGEPHWLAAMVDAEVLARIPVFNRTQIEGGFKPAVHAHLQSDKDDDSLDTIDEQFELTFMGDNGKPYVLTVGGANETLTITKLERGDHAGELDKTRSVSKEEIYHSYGIPPVLMGIDVKTGLSGKGLAITEELSLFQTTRVRPKQKLLEQAIKRVLFARGIMVPTVRIKPLVPFEPAEDAALTRQTYLRRVLVGEDRARAGLPIITTDGRDPAEDRSNWTPWMLQPLIAVGAGANMNEEQDANTQEPNA